MNCSLPPLVISTKAALLPRGEISLVVKVRETVKEQHFLHTGRHITRMGVQKIRVPLIDTTDRGHLACVSTGRYDLNREVHWLLLRKAGFRPVRSKETNTYNCSDNYIILI